MLGLSHTFYLLVLNAIDDQRLLALGQDFGLSLRPWCVELRPAVIVEEALDFSFEIGVVQGQVVVLLRFAFHFTD